MDVDGILAQLKEAILQQTEKNNGDMQAEINLLRETNRRLQKDNDSLTSHMDELENSIEELTQYSNFSMVRQLNTQNAELVRDKATLQRRYNLLNEQFNQLKADQERKQQLAEEERQQRLAEEEHQQRLAEEEQQRLAEEEQQRLEEEERQQRLAEEEQQRLAEEELARANEPVLVSRPTTPEQQPALLEESQLKLVPVELESGTYQWCSETTIMWDADGEEVVDHFKTIKLKNGERVLHDTSDNRLYRYPADDEETFGPAAGYVKGKKASFFKRGSKTKSQTQ